MHLTLLFIKQGKVNYFKSISGMRFLLVTLFSGIVLIGCNNENKQPDVSNIKVALNVRRFEKDLFAIDTNQTAMGMAALIAKYPDFGRKFNSIILNVDPRWNNDTAVNYFKGFLSTYRAVNDSVQKVFSNFEPYQKQLELSVKYLHYYFPNYPAPKRIITYVGPLDGYGDILDEGTLIVGLHLHLGENFSLYKEDWVRQAYPDYISNHFTPDNIAVNAMKNIVLDMYPETAEDKSLIVQMVEKGKRLYLLQKLVPYADDHQIIGYTQKQYKACLEREAVIWDLFIQNNFLQSIDNNIIKNYIGEGPKTQELGEASPGNIGSFCGWQIVKKYMQQSPSISLDSLLNTNAEIIFEKTKYKP